MIEQLERGATDAVTKFNEINRIKPVALKKGMLLITRTGVIKRVKSSGPKRTILEQYTEHSGWHGGMRYDTKDFAERPVIMLREDQFKLARDVIGDHYLYESVGGWHCMVSCSPGYFERLLARWSDALKEDEYNRKWRLTECYEWNWGSRSKSIAWRPVCDVEFAKMVKRRGRYKIEFFETETKAS